MLQYYALYIPFVWNLCLISVHISRCNSWYKLNDSNKIISFRCSFLSRHHVQCGDLLWNCVTVLSAGTNVWYQLFLHWKNNVPFKNFKSRTGWIFRKKNEDKLLHSPSNYWNDLKNSIELFLLLSTYDTLSFINLSSLIYNSPKTHL